MILFKLSLVLGLFMVDLIIPELLHILSPLADEFKVPLGHNFFMSVGMALIGIFIAFA